MTESNEMYAQFLLDFADFGEICHDFEKEARDFLEKKREIENTLLHIVKSTIDVKGLYVHLTVFNDELFLMITGNYISDDELGKIRKKLAWYDWMYWESNEPSQHLFKLGVGKFKCNIPKTGKV